MDTKETVRSAHRWWLVAAAAVVVVAMVVTGGILYRTLASGWDLQRLAAERAAAAWIERAEELERREAEVQGQLDEAIAAGEDPAMIAKQREYLARVAAQRHAADLAAAGSGSDRLAENQEGQPRRH